MSEQSIFVIYFDSEKQERVKGTYPATEQGIEDILRDIRRSLSTFQENCTIEIRKEEQ